MITDLNGRNAEILKKKKLWLLDMDGTIYNENEIFEGTLDLLQQIVITGEGIFSLPIIPPNP